MFCVVIDFRVKRSLKRTALNNLCIQFSILIIHVVSAVMKYKLIFIYLSAVDIRVTEFVYCSLVYLVLKLFKIVLWCFCIVL